MACIHRQSQGPQQISLLDLIGIIVTVVLIVGLGRVDRPVLPGT